MIIYFTGTGNSQYIAEALGDRLEDEVVNANAYIKSGERGRFESRSPWIFVFPVYVSAMAEVFYDFLKEADFSGAKKAYFVATCGSEMGISPNMGKAICEKKNLRYMGCTLVAMPENYIALFKIPGEEEIQKRQTEALKRADWIAGIVKHRKYLDKKTVSLPELLFTVGILKVYNRWFTRTEKFFTTEKCNGCGMCDRNCPLNNIHLVDKKPRWGKNCIHCMSCINRCPQKAIEYGKNTAVKERYVCKKYRPAAMSVKKDTDTEP